MPVRTFWELWKKKTKLSKPPSGQPRANVKKKCRRPSSRPSEQINCTNRLLFRIFVRMLRFLLYLKGYGVQKCDYKYFWLVGAPAGALFFSQKCTCLCLFGPGPGDRHIHTWHWCDRHTEGPHSFSFLTYGKAPVGFVGTVGPLGPHWRASYLMPLWAGAYGFILGPYWTI